MPPYGPPALQLAGVRLTWRGWAFLGSAVVAFVAAYAGGRHELLYVGAFLAVLPVIAVVVVRVRRPRLMVTRAFAPHIIAAGSTAAVTIVARNRAPNRSMRARWWDAVPWRPWRTPEADLPALEARGARFAGRGNATTLSYELRPPRRGIFPVGPMTVRLGDGFGLATTELVVGEQQSITVTPEVVPLGDTGMSMAAGDGESRLVQRRATGDDDDAMTREYRTGDAMRRVHWRATARFGDLMVRQEEQRSFPEARIIVDTRRNGYRDVSTDVHDGDAESESFEWVVRMLASVAVHLRRAGFLVSILETGQPQLEHVGRGRRRTWGDEEFLASLASLELVDTTADRGSDDRGHGEAGPIVAIMGVAEPETVEWLLRQRRPGELAVLFTVRDVTALDMLDRTFGVQSAVSPAVAERFADAGWLVVPVRADDDHAAAWDAVVVETGRARGSA